MRSVPEPAAGKAERESAPARPCPICGKPSVAAFRPFCSQRCADVDLNRWLGGVYAAPMAAGDEDEADRPAEDSEGR
jgi:endogenous inhibitor of DNA gyrase (YacG/DUF329 family)